MSFHETMLQDHTRIDRMLHEMIEAARAGDREELGRKWDRFEALLLAHINGEEMFMLPGLAHHDARRAQAIRDDHVQIRELLARVSLGLDLHLVREEHMQELQRRLEEHGRGEEVDFYRWADETLPWTTLSSLVRRIRAAV